MKEKFDIGFESRGNGTSSSASGTTYPVTYCDRHRRSSMLVPSAPTVEPSTDLNGGAPAALTISEKLAATPQLSYTADIQALMKDRFPHGAASFAVGKRARHGGRSEKVLQTEPAKKKRPFGNAARKKLVPMVKMLWGS
ncbi:hypothetical protein HK405_003510 [Cladochytrium tenue]|nr:hypothetical protein HK405_003510 [Cladochytrium tenue]